MATGGVITWGDASTPDVTITHSSNVLSFAGASVAYLFDAMVRVDKSGEAALLRLYRSDAHGIATTGRIEFVGRDNGSNDHSYALIDCVATDATNGSEDAELRFNVSQAGAAVQAMTLALGLRVGSPTGGDKGVGTINAVAVYDDNVLLTDYVFDRWQTGELDPADADNERAKAFDPSLLDIDTFSACCAERRALPAMVRRSEWSEETRFSLGELAQRLWETVEVQAVHIAKLNERVKALEGKMS
jgi:hypothetical protein